MMREPRQRLGIMSRRLWSRSKASRLSRHTQCKMTPGGSGLREKLLTVLAYCSSVVVERSMRGKLAAKPATSSGERKYVVAC